MTAAATELVPAYVLHRYPYRDTSLIVELLSLSQGRLGVVARGARSPKSLWRGLLEPFQPVLVGWRGRGDLLTLTGLEPAGKAVSLPGVRLASAFYCSELVLRLTRRHDPVPAVFSAFSTVLDQLAGDGPEWSALRLFEKRLLEASGYGVQLEFTADDVSPIRAEQDYRYLDDAGPMPSGTAPGPGVTISGRALRALAAEQLDDERLNPELQRLLGQLLKPHLGDKPLESRGMYKALSRSRG
ncbi:DNA repair protein RecO [Methylonatrum kenyense]|uniref:DNA repair protein RecO n=1 Tax=Methylonatrum kenyense TaxID=455253 RepID=UPI0020BFFF0A|nr:DNA repair protein RecO [Methylonatrum kenyense]MCK8514740.1 DNA repair protein RecO [Methylonatrum kenyense]